MSFYKNKMTKDDEEYILYGFEGDICIWQKLKGSTHHETRVFYANPGRELTARTTGELRIKINEYLNGGIA